MKIAIVAPSPVPFVVGGAEKLWWGMQHYLNEETTHACELIKIPVRETTVVDLIDAYYRFFKLDLSPFDRVISTKYPAFMVRHPDHHLYLQHLLRGCYDTYPAHLPETLPAADADLGGLLRTFGRPDISLEDIFAELFACLASKPDDPRVHQFPGPFIRQVLHILDRRGMAGVRRFAAISQTVRNRQDYFPPAADVTVIHHPSNLSGYRSGGQRYLFTVSRLDTAKRIDLLLRGYLQSRTPLPLLIAGTGPQEAALKQLAAGDQRVRFLGFVSDRELVDYYADAAAVLYAPYDEDFGLVTIEAFSSGKPVITCTDSGGVTEFVVDGANGYVVAPDAASLAAAIDRLPQLADAAVAGRCRAAVAEIRWERLLATLLQPGGPAAAGSAAVGGDSGHVAHLQRHRALAVRDSYQVGELLALKGDTLVTTAYRCLLHREPDPAACHYLQRLTEGSLLPLVFLGELRFSSEGRRVGVAVRGLARRLIYHRLQGLPLLGYALRLGVALVRLPMVRREMIRDLEAVQAALAAKADLAALDQKVDRAALATKAGRDLLQSGNQAVAQALADLTQERAAVRALLAHKAAPADLQGKAGQGELRAFKQAVRSAERAGHAVDQQLRDLLHARNRQPSAGTTRDPADHAELCLALTGLYRGSPQAVSAALAAYAALWPPPASPPDLPQRALDLGCDRGDMLRWLTRQGLAAVGVDPNPAAVRACRTAGLTAVHADLLSYLAAVEAGSLGVITGLHLAERLTSGELFRLLEGALRALAPGGLLLLETANPRNLLVAAGDFYRDLSHNRPLFPDTLRFLLEYFGYADSGLFFFDHSAGAGRRLVPAGRVRFDELRDYLEVSRDYAVAGYKPCA